MVHLFMNVSVDGISATTSSTQIWKTIRARDGRRSLDKINEVLEVNGTTYAEDKNKTEQFAKTYKSFSKLPTKRED